MWSWCSPISVRRCGHGLASRHGGTPSPQPNSGLPEFGRSMTWPKSETSDFGWGEGGGEGATNSRSFVTPHPTPRPSGEGAGRTRGSAVPQFIYALPYTEGSVRFDRRSNHLGTGSPCARRKVGLNSLD